VQSNVVAYEGVQKERRADLRSTLEVLSIEQSLRQAELARSLAKHDTYVASANLVGAMGCWRPAPWPPASISMTPRRPSIR